MTDAQLTSSDEIRGDWSNIKGTEYHFLYALWLLLRKHEASVSFYQGNDLVVQPQVVRASAPPLASAEIDNSDEYLIPVPLYAQHGATDEWVQLKATKRPWSPSLLMSKNLLINFIHNAMHSERLGRSWSVSLVTEGLVQRSAVEEFIRSPNSHRDLNKKLTEVVDAARERLRTDGWSAAEIEPSNLRSVALAVLSQLAKSEPVPLGMLKSDIEVELTHAYPDRDVVIQIGGSLIGAMLHDAGLGPAGARPYDADWINQAAGRPVIKLGLLSDNPVAACTEAVKRAAFELRYEPGLFTTRVRLKNALGRFMSADETLFVLVGGSGSGKTWGVVNWADEELGERLRLLIPGSDLDERTTLKSLVANRLRPFSSAQWEDELILSRLTTAAELEGRGPVTLLIEDLVSTRDVNAFRRNLARIARDCRVHGIKLVLTCQRHVWELHGLGAEMLPDDLFVMNAFLPQEDCVKAYGSDTAPSPNSAAAQIIKEQRYSFLLADFSPEEQRDALRRYLPRERADKISDQLRAPGFTLLLSPYLLARYLDRYLDTLKGTNEAPPMEVDDLLDWYIDDLIQKAALELSSSRDDIRPAFSALVQALWISRPAGLTYAQAVGHLTEEFPERGADAMVALRRFGLLNVEGRVRIAEPLVSDRLFAVHAGQQLRQHGDDFLDELNLEADAGMVVALLRNETPDPVTVGEKLMARSGEWAGSVAAGLAQGATDDWRSMAILTTLATSNEERVSSAGYAALGQISARGKRSWKWTAEMYLGDHAQKWHRGARALAGVMEYRPQRVEAAIRTRLTRVLHIDEVFATNLEKRNKWLTNDALDPLRGINHESAAQIGKRIVRRYEHLVGGELDWNRDWNFIDDLDHSRGRVALLGSGDSLRVLLEELSTGSEVARYRAALALRPFIAERPDAVRAVLIDRLTAETDWVVLERLLLIAFHLIERYPDELLAALRQSRALNFGEPLQTTGLVLSLLGNLAGKRHTEVEQLLPSRLDAHEGWSRALLTEVLAYAWWRCAERNEIARDRLKALSEPDLTGVSDECIPFALRGSAIALLGLMCVEQGVSTDELTGKQVFYPNMGKAFLYVETVDLFRKNAALLREHPSFGHFEELLVRSICEEEKMQAHPIQPVRQAQFRCAVKCLELIVQIAVLMEDPISLLNSLPRDWQAIRAATRLLEMGRTEAQIVGFARDSFAGLEHEGTLQAVEERRRCQAQLALLPDDNDHASLQEQRRSSLGSLFQKPGNALGLSVLAAKEPANVLPHLGYSIQTEHDLPTLYFLVEEARSWQTLLIARVYGRMFNSKLIDLHEARDLCEQMLSAVGGLPDSALCQEYVAVYSAIDALLHNQNVSLPEFPVLSPDPTGNLIHSSHLGCAAVVARAIEDRTVPSDGSWIDDYRYDRHNWLETHFYELRHSLLLSGTGFYLMYFFPAARLALAAAGEQSGFRDPAGCLMAERRETYDQLRDHLKLLNHASLVDCDADLVIPAVSAFESRATVTPRDERIQNWLGGVLLRLNRLTEAEAAFQRSLVLPGCQGDARASALYDLACVYARQNKENACRSALEESAILKQPGKQLLVEDPDLESIRDRDWFRSLLSAAG